MSGSLKQKRATETIRYENLSLVEQINYINSRDESFATPFSGHRVYRYLGRTAASKSLSELDFCDPLEQSPTSLRRFRRESGREGCIYREGAEKGSVSGKRGWLFLDVRQLFFRFFLFSYRSENTFMAGNMRVSKFREKKYRV